VKIALGQINTTIGDFEGTVRRVAKFVASAKKKGADLIAFPEMTLTGYPPRDLVEVPSFVEKNLRALEEVAKLSQGIAIIIGYVGRNENGGGKSLLNAAALCRDGKVVASYVKNLLPTYDVFDEGRYFEPGKAIGLWDFESFSKKIGISICEDIWNDKLFWEKRLYPHDPIEEQVNLGADFLLNISSSPFSLGKDCLRRDMLQAVALRHGVPLFYVNLVGGNDELVFDGRSLTVNERGEVIAEGEPYEEDLVVVDLEEMSATGENPPMEEVESIYRTLVLGLRDYVRKCGFKKVVLGLSGGIDSSLVAAIAAEALGPENVIGVRMPSPYSSKGSLTDSALLAKNLGIKMETYPIKGIFHSYRRLLKRKGGREPDLAEENVQARIRGNLLMALSNRYGYLVLSTGNKSELAVGYCTLYGDMSGGLSIISDLPKTMVYEVARFVQKRKSVIPEAVFSKPPSAELRPNQTDQDSLPPYEILDPILKAYIEEHRSEEEIIQMGFPPQTVKQVVRNVNRNEYKRRQAAPGIKITSKAFGIGRRFPIARKI
jgi:NAD+ synthase (glutamine-hydrolysing)